MTHKFDQVILSYDFQINDSDKCVYVKFFYDNGCVICKIVCVCVCVCVLFLVNVII